MQVALRRGDHVVLLRCAVAGRPLLYIRVYRVHHREPGSFGLTLDDAYLAPQRAGCAEATGERALIGNAVDHGFAFDGAEHLGENAPDGILRSEEARGPTVMCADFGAPHDYAIGVVSPSEIGAHVEI